jgi:hypothetical protein
MRARKGETSGAFCGTAGTVRNSQNAHILNPEAPSRSWAYKSGYVGIVGYEKRDLADGHSRPLRR